ncbi:MAG: CinA family nicotinamide mononucleotide deamidase-related protein [Saprospiraceae bacterium]|nr:CinA family nicotinamide mononucleotide deamidase-related protein [Saprospiraceae bacterium]
MRIALLIIGDEILLGQVVDTNSARIARFLYEAGLHIHAKLTVSDTEADIVGGLQWLKDKADLILMTGGLGPTKDDITKKALASFLNTKLVFSDEARLQLEKILSKRNRVIDEMQLLQCYIPEQAKLLNNELGTANGLWIEADTKLYIAMPGVPYEMENIMQMEVMPRLKKFPNQHHIIHRSLLTGGLGETQIAKRIEPLLNDVSKDIQLAYLPSIGQVRLRLSHYHARSFAEEKELENAFEIIQNEMQDVLIGEGDISLEEKIGQLLMNKASSLATAESCTGGLIAKKICAIPGASNYFKGGIVAYQYDIKEKILAVKHQTLETDGAVSENCVREMVLGALQIVESDFAIACSGIAGPDGGTPEKPVGTVWMACGNKEHIVAKKYVFPWDRTRNIEATSVYALLLFWDYLKSRDKQGL